MPGAVPGSIWFNPNGKSRLDEAQGEVIAVPPGKEPIRAPAVVRKNTTTLVRLESGKAVLVSSDAKHDATDEKTSGRVDMVILGAEVVGD